MTKLGCSRLEGYCNSHSKRRINGPRLFNDFVVAPLPFEYDKTNMEAVNVERV